MEPVVQLRRRVAGYVMCSETSRKLKELGVEATLDGDWGRLLWSERWEMRNLGISIPSWMDRIQRPEFAKRVQLKCSYQKWKKKKKRLEKCCSSVPLLTLGVSIFCCHFSKWLHSSGLKNAHIYSLTVSAGWVGHEWVGSSALKRLQSRFWQDWVLI